MQNAYHDMVKAAEALPLSEFLTRYPSGATVYTAVRRSMVEICSESGFSGREICRRFGISYRTMEEWTSGRRSCPVYLRLMFQEMLGIYQPPSL